MDLDALYQQLIIDHHKNPRNWGKIQPADREAVGHNPLCGDKLVLTLKLSEDGTRITDARFEGEGCAISTASASMMTEAIRGKTIEEAKAMFEAFHAMATGEAPPDAERLGKLAALAGVRAFPARVKCATLAWHTLMQALAGGGVATTE
ncbi:MAG: SUF system NifU family Fe-S cluster assembly protein [Zetaproteobacteria bacterium]|nr:MAG: SUF system NifU family Fe-S cluster assembly protein [Zetaproteobacteria bacterium]